LDHGAHAIHIYLFIWSSEKEGLKKGQVSAFSFVLLFGFEVLVL